MINIILEASKIILFGLLINNLSEYTSGDDVARVITIAFTSVGVALCYFIQRKRGEK